MHSYRVSGQDDPVSKENLMPMVAHIQKVYLYFIHVNYSMCFAYLIVNESC